MHSLQTLIVALLVPGCTIYAAWKLMPATARRSFAASLLRVPHLPKPLDAALRRRAAASAGCGCDGCDRVEAAHPAPAATPAAQPIRFHPRTRR
ncbi:MAG TPA: DUF6587 family protein [Burkholderiaceae bacterium]|nr:DUF6587 family protein [Burkholderiaceae bacterium]